MSEHHDIEVKHTYKAHKDRALIEPLSHGGLYVLARNLPVDPMDFGIDKLKFIVPKGFVTDGASIPRFLWRVTDTPFSPDIITAAIVHDFLFSLDSESFIQWDFESANLLFHGMLMAHGNGSVKAGALYRAVKWFGRRSYQKACSYEKLQ